MLNWYYSTSSTTSSFIMTPIYNGKAACKEGQSLMGGAYKRGSAVYEKWTL
jgi:hypothetical protein